MSSSMRDLFVGLKPKVNEVIFQDYAARDDVLRRATFYSRRAFGPDNYFIAQVEGVRFESGIYIGGRGPSPYDRRLWEEGKRDLNNIIDLMIEELGPEDSESYLPTSEKAVEALKTRLEKVKKESIPERKGIELIPPIDSLGSNRVFIVHGRDEEMKHHVARTLTQLHLVPVILHEQPNRGRTIIEKFVEEASDVGFAIVLFSPDDEGHRIGEAELVPRARQNVILELGFFFGKLGRGKIVVLYKDIEGFDLPSDIAGIIYIPYDSSGAWRIVLVGELIANGYDVSADDLF